VYSNTKWRAERNYRERATADSRADHHKWSDGGEHAVLVYLGIQVSLGGDGDGTECMLGSAIWWLDTAAGYSKAYRRSVRGALLQVNVGS
jgi:hypothetical protein